MMSRSRGLLSGVFGGLCALLLAGVVQAQPPGGPGFGGFGAGGIGGGSLELLLRQDVQRELELLETQVAELRQAVEGMRGQMRELFAEVQDVPREQRAQRLRELAEQMREDVQAEVDKVLLPHQQQRLAQLANQMRMRGGVTRAITSEPVAEELGLTDAQKEKLQARAEQLEAELRQRMAELRLKAQEELLKELSPQQQAKWREMVGEPFEFQAGQQLGGPAGGEPARRPGGEGGRFGGEGGRFGGAGAGRGAGDGDRRPAFGGRGGR